MGSEELTFEEWYGRYSPHFPGLSFTIFHSLAMDALREATSRVLPGQPDESKEFARTTKEILEEKLLRWQRQRRN